MQDRRVNTIGELQDFLREMLKVEGVDHNTKICEFHHDIDVNDDNVNRGIICGLSMFDKYEFEFKSNSLLSEKRNTKQFDWTKNYE